jgi:hypothetical protein
MRKLIMRIAEDEDPSGPSPIPSQALAVKIFPKYNGSYGCGCRASASPGRMWIFKNSLPQASQTVAVSCGPHRSNDKISRWPMNWSKEIEVEVVKAIQST